MKSNYLQVFPILLFAAACEPQQPEPAERPQPEAAAPADQRPGPRAATTEPPQTAIAEIAPTEGHDTSGTVRFTADGDTVRVQGTIEGLAPGAHGLHIHANGDCSAPDASSAGGHLSPDDDPHGSPQDLPDQHHLGDLGNIVAAEDGKADIAAEDDEISLSGPDSVVGKAVVVHAGRDDLESQPSGDSGARVGCGVIRLAQSDAARTSEAREPEFWMVRTGTDATRSMTVSW